ncbi:hypothetical protein AAY473_038673 [Plecturocebus cupreus]
MSHRTLPERVKAHDDCTIKAAGASTAARFSSESPQISPCGGAGVCIPAVVTRAQSHTTVTASSSPSPRSLCCCTGCFYGNCAGIVEATSTCCCRCQRNSHKKGTRRALPLASLLIFRQ